MSAKRSGPHRVARQPVVRSAGRSISPPLPPPNTPTSPAIEVEELLESAAREIEVIRQNSLNQSRDSLARESELRLELIAAVEDAQALREQVKLLNNQSQDLADENARLVARVEVLVGPPAEQLLEGWRVGIIGHPGREPDYRAILERHGGTFLYASPNEKLALIDRVVQKSDGTIFITGWASHKAMAIATAAAARSGKIMLPMPQSGLATLEDTILKYLLPLLQSSGGSATSS